MPLIHAKQDLTTVTRGVIAHGVNCQKKNGFGGGESASR